MKSLHLVITPREPGFRSVDGVVASYCDQCTIADLDSKPHLEVVDTPELQNAVGENIKKPKNDHDDLVTLYLGILRNYWSREETQQHLNAIKRFFLDDLGYKQKKQTGKISRNEPVKKLPIIQRKEGQKGRERNSPCPLFVYLSKV